MSWSLHSRPSGVRFGSAVEDVVVLVLALLAEPSRFFRAPSCEAEPMNQWQDTCRLPMIWFAAGIDELLR